MGTLEHGGHFSLFERQEEGRPESLLPAAQAGAGPGQGERPRRDADRAPREQVCLSPP